MAQNEVNDIKVVMIGGSAGSLDVLLYILPLLKKDIKPSIIIVLHRKTNADSPLVSLLAAKSFLPVTEAEEKQKILPGHIYIAPTDYHLLIERDYSFSLDYSEKINFSRPSIDVSFETAAEVLGKNLTAILLSGANADGVEGLITVVRNGGTTIVQDPATATVAFMPAEALKRGITDKIYAPAQIADYINCL